MAISVLYIPYQLRSFHLPVNDTASNAILVLPSIVIVTRKIEAPPHSGIHTPKHLSHPTNLATSTDKSSSVSWSTEPLAPLSLPAFASFHPQSTLKLHFISRPLRTYSELIYAEQLRQPAISELLNPSDGHIIR